MVHGGDFQLATGRGLDALGYIDHLVRVEVQAYHCIVRLGLCRFLFDGEAVSVCIELGHAIAFGVAHPIAEYGGLLFFFGSTHGLAEHGGKPVSVENVVAQHQAGGIVTDELLADEEGLCQAVGRGLLGIFETHAEVAAIAQQTLEARQVVRGGDDEYLADAGQHEHGYGVVYHGLVEYRKHLFGHALGDGV